MQTWIEADPEDANAYNRLGVVLFQLDRDKEGYEAFVKAKQLNDDLPQAYISAGSMYQLRDKHELALRSYQEAYKKDKNDRITVMSYAEYLIKRGKLSEAKQILDAGLKSNPDVYQIQLLAGVLAEMTNDKDAAENYYFRALALSPGNREVTNQLAQLLIDQDDPNKQKRAQQLALVNAKINPNSPDVNITLAWVLYRAERKAEANEAYRKGISLGRFNGDSALIVAKLLSASNQKETARKVLEGALKSEKGIFVRRAEAEALLETL